MEKQSRWLVAGATLISGYWLGVRPWHIRWGSTDEERIRTMPGDERIANPDYLSTRAITIDASPRTVWAQLLRLQKMRGSFIPSLLSSILSPILSPVLSMEERHFLVLETLWNQNWGRGMGTCSFELLRLETRKTRLICRIRARIDWSPQQLILFPLVDLGAFIGVRDWLLGIKTEAESIDRRRDLKLMTNLR